MALRPPSRATSRSSRTSSKAALNMISEHHYTLSIPHHAGAEREVRLQLDSGRETARKTGGSPRNCYAFACGRKRNIPGGTRGPVSMPWQVTPETIDEALRLDGAIPLGKNPATARDPATDTIDPTKEYYLIAAMFHTEEFHFARLFSDGWWAKPSKVGLADQMTERVLVPPGKTAFKGLLCRAGPGGKSYHPVGYYLVPVPPSRRG